MSVVQKIRSIFEPSPWQKFEEVYAYKVTDGPGRLNRVLMFKVGIFRNRDTQEVHLEYGRVEGTKLINENCNMPTVVDGEVKLLKWGQGVKFHNVEELEAYYR